MSVRPVLSLVVVVALGALLPASGPDVPIPEGFWKTLGPPTRGTWRDIVEEKPQTFAAYKDAGPARPTALRKKIYIQPLLTRPPRDPKLLTRIAKALEAFFGRSVTVRKPIPIPPRAFDAKNRRITVFRLLPTLITQLPKDALFQLAVTDRDLWLGKGGRAFGWSSFQWRVGIMSTRRLGAEEQPIRRRFRMISLALHEAGHLLSIPHCLYFECLMNGARTMREAEKRPILLCPVCRAKLCWNLGLRPGPRYTALESAYRRMGLTPAARRSKQAADVTSDSKKG